MITLTEEQAQQIEEALDTAYGLAESDWTEHKYAAALAIIRAARAQADHIAGAGKVIGCAYCDNPLFAGTKCNNCGRVTLAEQAEQEPEYDLSNVIHLTHNKAKHIIKSRGYSVTGFVLTREDGGKCIVDMSAVRWFDDKLVFQRMMHSDTPKEWLSPPVEHVKQEPVGVVTKESLDGVVKWNGWIPREGTKLYAAPVEPVKQEPVAFADKYGNVMKAKEKLTSTNVRDNWYDRPLYEKAAFDADLYSVAGKLALELECLLLDTKDLSVVSKWWDSAHDALEQWRTIKYAAPVRTKDLTEKWIDPNDKSQKQYLPHIGEKVLFCCDGEVYYGHHTGGAFQKGHGVKKSLFPTWDCMWMHLPAAVIAAFKEKNTCTSSN